MSKMHAAIKRGVEKTMAEMLNGDGVLVGGMAKTLADAIMAETPLSNAVLGILDAEFRRRLKRSLMDLGEQIRERGMKSPPKAMPDRIAEWVEGLERISTALYDFTENEDVLEALRFISMSGREWSDYLEGCEEETSIPPFILKKKPNKPQSQVIIKMQNGVPRLVRKPHNVTVGIVGYDLAGNRMAPLWLEAAEEAADGD